MVKSARLRGSAYSLAPAIAVSATKIALNPGSGGGIQKSQRIARSLTTQQSSNDKQRVKPIAVDLAGGER